jgi:hypothetical protein
MTVTAVAVSRPGPSLHVLPRPLAENGTGAPVWSVGDQWTYRFDRVAVNLTDPSFTVHVNASIATLTSTVTNESAHAYTNTISPTSLSGDFAVALDFGDGPVNISGDLSQTTLSGTITYNKTTVGVTAIDLVVEGTIALRIIDQPYFDPIFPDHTFSVPMTVHVAATFDIPRSAIVFPLNLSNLWGLSAVNVTVTGTAESSWFVLINFINEKIRAWNLIEPLARLLGTDAATLQVYSDILADLLPIVDIEYVMTTYMGTNVFSLPAFPEILYCGTLETITVPAGTYPSYNITLLGGLGALFFAPAAGNMVRVQGQFAEVFPFVEDIQAELVDTNYS